MFQVGGGCFAMKKGCQKAEILSLMCDVMLYFCHHIEWNAHFVSKCIWHIWNAISPNFLNIYSLVWNKLHIVRYLMVMTKISMWFCGKSSKSLKGKNLVLVTQLWYHASRSHKSLSQTPWRDLQGHLESPVQMTSRFNPIVINSNATYKIRGSQIYHHSLVGLICSSLFGSETYSSLQCAQYG